MVMKINILDARILIKIAGYKGLYLLKRVAAFRILRQRRRAGRSGYASPCNDVKNNYLHTLWITIL